MSPLAPEADGLVIVTAGARVSTAVPVVNDNVQGKNVPPQVKLLPPALFKMVCLNSTEYAVAGEKQCSAA